MGRSLVVTKIDYPCYKLSSGGKIVDIVIANSHFESVFKRNDINEIKIKQYEIARNILESLYKKYNNVILCSDTNVMSHEEHKLREQFENNGWIDSWSRKGLEINKNTYDTYNNVHLNLKLSKFTCRSRIDRIIFKCNNCDLKEFNLLKGTQEIMEPSDHFGVYSKYSVQYS